MILCFFVNGILTKDCTENRKYMESYEKVLIEWTSLKDHLVCDEGVQVEETDLFKLVVMKYSSKLVEAFIDSRLSSQVDNVFEIYSNFIFIFFISSNI